MCEILTDSDGGRSVYSDESRTDYFRSIVSPIIAENISVNSTSANRKKTERVQQREIIQATLENPFWKDKYIERRLREAMASDQPYEVLDKIQAYENVERKIRDITRIWGQKGFLWWLLEHLLKGNTKIHQKPYWRKCIGTEHHPGCNRVFLGRSNQFLCSKDDRDGCWPQRNVRAVLKNKSKS